MKTLDILVALIAGIGISLLLATLLEEVERRERQRIPECPSL